MIRRYSQEILPPHRERKRTKRIWHISHDTGDEDRAISRLWLWSTCVNPHLPHHSSIHQRRIQWDSPTGILSAAFPNCYFTGSTLFAFKFSIYTFCSLRINFNLSYFYQNIHPPMHIGVSVCLCGLCERYIDTNPAQTTADDVLEE